MQINKDLFTHYWDANWITCAGASSRYGVYIFRKTFDLVSKPKQFVVHVSADNRYRFFVNGTPVCFGPARGDLMHWYFETIDIAKNLRTGKNAIAAVVWNMGDYKPFAQISLRTAFIVQGNSPSEQIVNTNDSWKVIENKAYAPLPAGLNTYIVVGPGDRVIGRLYPWNWHDINYDDKKWQKSVVTTRGRTRTVAADQDWGLIPRDIPFMEEKKLRLLSVRRILGIKTDGSFIKGTGGLKIPAKTKVTILLDQGYLTTAYPELIVSSGKNSKIELCYAEALYDKDGRKNNRDDIDDKNIRGNIDEFYPDGKPNRMFRPLWFRTYRYIQMTIATKAMPLTINDFYGIFTAYPFVENASFKSDAPMLNKIWEVGWRTLRLCSNETYFDCPYYEQLQYLGDTRIQCLISLYVSGDERLTRKAIRCFDRSRIYEGLTMSRFPVHTPQVIPPFSLYWTQMVYDYWMHRDDPEFISEFLTGIDSVFGWFEQRIDKKTGMLGIMPYWNFVDWAAAWKWDPSLGTGGVPDGIANGGSSILSLHFAYALRNAAEMFRALNKNERSEHYNFLAESISAAAARLCWDEKKKYIADTPAKKTFSQHAQTFAVLAEAELPVDTKELISRCASDKSIIQSTVYFTFYLMRAMKKMGLAEKYVEMLDTWKNMIGLGLTTFAECPEPTRSDCHAWSSSPNYEFLATICGIEPGEPGFKSVLIQPHLGTLKKVAGRMKIPAGIIKVEFEKKENTLEGSIELPPKTSGKFIYNGTVIELREGIRKIRV